MREIVAGGNTMAALKALRDSDPILGLWSKYFEAEHGRPPNEEEIQKRREEIAVMEEQCRKDHERESRLKQQAREDVTIMVGTCQCDGEISYRSRFVAIGSVWDMPIGSRIPTEEACECFCTSCGLMYNPWHKPFREKLEAYRQRLD